MTLPTPPEPAMPTTDLTEAPPLPEPQAWNCQLVMNHSDGVVEGWFTTKPETDPDDIPEGWDARIERVPVFTADQLRARDAMWAERVRAAMSGASATDSVTRRTRELQEKAGMPSRDARELACREALPADAVNQMIGDLMILQVLADSEQVNDQEREVLQRWIARAEIPTMSGAAIPAGFALVPAEPTPEMLEPAARAWCEEHGINPDEPVPPHGEYPRWYEACGPYAEIYRSALAAAPTPTKENDRD